MKLMVTICDRIQRGLQRDPASHPGG